MLLIVLEDEEESFWMLKVSHESKQGGTDGRKDLKELKEMEEMEELRKLRKHGRKVCRKKGGMERGRKEGRKDRKEGRERGWKEGRKDKKEGRE